MRRAGYVFRQKYEQFLYRYKMLSETTWPHWHGSPAKGVQEIFSYLNDADDEYAFGKTKIFIKNPRTVRLESCSSSRFPIIGGLVIFSIAPFYWPILSTFLPPLPFSDPPILVVVFLVPATLFFLCCSSLYYTRLCINLM